MEENNKTQDKIEKSDRLSKFQKKCPPNIRNDNDDDDDLLIKKVGRNNFFQEKYFGIPC